LIICLKLYGYKNSDVLMLIQKSSHKFATNS
jgi:hypothetical protein